jgi:hypothetical protein
VNRNNTGVKMNYQKIHDKFIDYFKKTTPKERLMRRNPKDNRLNEKYLYVETHHIQPKSLKGKDKKENLVIILPEEHLFIHVLRYKAFNTYVDFKTVMFMINGYKNVSNDKMKFNFDREKITKSIRTSYSWFRQNKQSFRKKHGWQTVEGRKKISESRKGKVSMVNVLTGESLGMKPTNHPKFLMGEWVTHDKGKRKPRPQGDLELEKNPRWSGITDEEILKCSEEFFIEYGSIPGPIMVMKYMKKKNEKYITSITNSRFGGEGYKYVIKYLEEKYKVSWNPKQKVKY